MHGWLVLGSTYRDLEDEEVYDSIEEALLTNCPYCGTELEWSLTVKWDPKLEVPTIHGDAFSCGVKFKIEPQSDGSYMTRIYSE